MSETSDCIFCSIIAGKAPVSIVHEDEKTISFMNIRPMREGECMVIPKDHIDHFTDVPDDLAAHMMKIAQRLGRSILAKLNHRPLRIGYVVHGFGVAHAHLVIVPQHDEHDITSLKFFEVVDGKIVPAQENLPPPPPRAELDRVAKLIKVG